MNDVESKLLSIKRDVDDALEALKEVEEVKEVQEVKEEPVAEIKSEEVESVSETPSVDKTWTTDKTLKFKDGAGGRVSLSFPRIMDLIKNNIDKGNTKKDWSTIKSKLTDANSVGEVQSIISDYKMSFSSNYVAGTKKRRRGGKRRTHRRH